ncbi:MAG: TlpA family protein disulfide reductase [Fidelibacterota bacterium]
MKIILPILLFSLTLIQAENPPLDWSRFRAKTVAGDTVLLTTVLDDTKPTLLYFWSIYCSVCARDLPKTEALFAKYNDQVNMLGIAWRESPDKVNRHFEKKKHRIHTVIDLSGNLFSQFGVGTTPTIIILDRNREIVLQGYPSRRKITKTLASLLVL